MNEKLNKALEGISDRHIAEAAGPAKKRRLWLPVTAAVVAAAILIGLLWWPGLPQKPISTDPIGQPILTGLLAAPQLPAMVQYPETPDGNYQAWREGQKAQYDQPEGYADSLESFFVQSIPEFLSGEGNQVYSPVNVYMALAMLAEATGGTTQQELLALLGADSMEALRTQAGHVWNAHYSADGLTELTMANSMWIDEGFPVRQSTADLLASSYYASAYQGDLQSQDMNKALQSWLNQQTRGLLQDAAEDTEFQPQTVFALASTMYFSAKWETRFREECNTPGTFTGSQGQQDVEFMNQSLGSTYYRGENFGAVQLPLSGENSMWIILPDEGVTVQQVLEGGEYLTMTLNPGNWTNKKTCLLHLSIPKFDVNQQSSLIPGLQSLGVTEIFGNGDFTPLADAEDLFVSDITHAARVLIDEEGVEAAAFTLSITNATGGAPDPDEITFTADRSFLFTVSSRDNLPLFAGIVDRPV